MRGAWLCVSGRCSFSNDDLVPGMEPAVFADPKQATPQHPFTVSSEDDLTHYLPNAPQRSRSGCDGTELDLAAPRNVVAPVWIALRYPACVGL